MSWSVLNSTDSAKLPPDSIDLAFICETYHHFEHPREMLGLDSRRTQARRAARGC